MKTLMVSRQAKSSWKDECLSDHDRPLNGRGERAAPRMGKLIRQEGLTPDVIVCSTAVRAKRTAELAAESSGFSGRFHFLDDLYLATASAALNLVRQLPDELSIAMLVAHNPGLEDLVQRFSGIPIMMPTAALAHIRFPYDTWSLVAPGCDGNMVEQWLPRDLE